MADYTRPKEGFRFKYGGVNTQSVPDALPPDKYAIAFNVRSTGSNSIRTRPGYVPYFHGANAAITDIRAYTALGTDALPRTLARDQNSAIWLDNNNSVGNLAAGGFGVSMIPFRPSESPNTWMYIGSQADYQKFSAPDANNNVVQYKVGIAEPQQALQAAPMTLGFYTWSGNFNNGGTAGSIGGGTRSNDTLGACVVDPALSTRYYVQVGNNANSAYAPGEFVVIGANGAVVQDVFPPIQGNITIQSIRYAAGNSGNCVITPSQIPGGTTNQLATLRRGSLVKIGASETVAVLGLIPGPNGLYAFETSTANSWTAGAAIAGLPALAVDAGGAVFSPGQTIVVGYGTSNISTGIGTLSTVFGANLNPFVQSIAANTVPQQDDYVHVSVNLSDPTQLIQLLILFDLDPGGNNFNGNVMYYAVRPGDLVGISNGDTTLLPAILQAAENEIIGELPTPGNIASPSQSSSGNNQWAEITFPISSLTRLGGDYSRTLANCTGMQFQINVSNNITFQYAGMWVGGGGQPDVGNNGAYYSYQAVPLSSLTGVRGNPTPLMRYGVNPRRQPVIVKTSNLNANYDAQIDTWEVFRYGGSITSYRFAGTTPVGSDFTDVYFDDALTGGNAIVIDNTEPWPSIDMPYRANNANAFGPVLIIPGNNNSFPLTITRWLPGTIFQIGNNDAYTLRKRPVSLGGNNGYLFEFEECIGSGAQSAVFVLEPNVARQTLPYLWGPDEHGTVFGCGDPLRPGVVSFAKGYSPDAVPTAYDVDLCPPSEPLLGGEVIDGISLVASSLRWWALYYQTGGSAPYQQVERSIGKRLVSTFGKCTDGKQLYFWATDCIAVTSAQGPAISLTDDDLYNLFPHGGIDGKNVVRSGLTYYAPDYSKCETFRIAIREGILQAIYVDSTSTFRMITAEIKTTSQGISVAWGQDTPADAISAIYSFEQPTGTLTINPALYPAVAMGSAAGKVFKVKDLTGDNGNAITGVVGTFEFDGGDIRSNQQWGDAYVDVTAPGNNGIAITPVSLGVAVGNATLLPQNASRQFSPVSLGGEILQNFLGLILSWSDFGSNSQTVPTTLHAWQPSFVDKPETIQDRFGDWVDFGQASYVRGLIFHADTFGANKNISIRNADNNNLIQFAGGLAPGQINHNGEQEIAYYFNPPFVAHMVRDEPQDLLPWRRFGIEWIKDPWPELTNLDSAWLDLGQQGAKYLRGAVMPMDTNGQPVSLTFLSSDGGSSTVGPFTTTAAEKTAVPWAFAIPLIGHDFQLIPSGPIRVWYEEIRWDFDAWPELINEATGWLPVRQGGGASFLQGVVLPLEANGLPLSLNLLTDTGLTIPLMATVQPLANIKTGVPYSLATPVVCHQVQILPSKPCRIWLGEIQWIAEPTPELASTWTTQWSALGGKGYKHIPRIEAAYSSSADVTLLVQSYDGKSPRSLTLPASGGTQAKILLTLSLNKGQLYRFSATSSAPFQMFQNDFIIWVADWGRGKGMRAYRNLGAEFGDGARI